MVCVRCGPRTSSWNGRSFDGGATPPSRVDGVVLEGMDGAQERVVVERASLSSSVGGERQCSAGDSQNSFTRSSKCFLMFLEEQTLSFFIS